MKIASLPRAVVLLAIVSAGLRAQVFDLSALPIYAPAAPSHGVVRLHDTELSQHLVHLWQDAFLQHHPLVRYSEYTVPAWFSGLGADTADLAVAGRRAYRADLKALEGIWG
jgi:phosphate transport system substrate-binding protein